MINNIINFIKKFPLTIFILLALIPLFISLLMFIPWFSLSKGSVEGWLGFWGSYLGGTIGTLGVIATTYFLIKHETEITNKNIEVEDLRKRDFLFLELQIKKYEEITNSILELNSKWVDVSNTLMELSISKEDFLIKNEESEQQVKGKLIEYYNKRKILADKQNRLLLHLKTFHDDDKLRNFLKRVNDLVERYNKLSEQIAACTDIKENYKYTNKIENIVSEEFEAYDEILTYYTEQYKSILYNINQKNK